MRIGVISLGCDKNRVDTEKMLSRLTEAGHVIVGSEEAADIIIVNTCAFIDSAKEESIDEILGALEHKKDGKKVIVTGCLSQRYMSELKAEFPEVDGFLGVADYDSIADTVDKIAGGERVCRSLCGDAYYGGRVLTTPYHYAYLKIADGCSNRCTYCAIPSIRGNYRSEKTEDLLREARTLSDNGVKELILVAQDVTRYGTDFDSKPHLTELVRALEELDFEWIRLMYLEPEMVDDGLLDFIAGEPKVVKYADIPFQHVDDGVLKRMNRRTDYKTTLELTRKVKERGIVMRSSFICGFPGESDEAYDKLKTFIAEEKIDYAGFFAYSREENTPADRLRGHLDEDVKQARAEELRRIQTAVIKEKNTKLIGNTYKVIFDDIDYDLQTFAGRAQFQAPDVDNRILFTSQKPLEVGNFYSVKITGTDGIDLVGTATGD